MNLQPRGAASDAGAPEPAAAKSLAWIAFADILVFFGVLLVGFAYLWRRGGLGMGTECCGPGTGRRNRPSARSRCV
ncbi:NADH-quinone oxidoreductase subunit A [Gemmata sp. G18]|uniref:NADH-quinone oxidoreductase subunit n=1 Tax=Gemmata palustris TaxID=2822762 RepID=A0ABS5BWJ8_9BACT|nr:NADH-quinone oxidoreductase subunit A [Gemmata palustris]MBP3958053.1 NADH-quinone oxidoreductase subunit A [Gemmata palustris]